MTTSLPPAAAPQPGPIWPRVIGVLSIALAAQKLLLLVGTGIQVVVQLVLVGPGGGRNPRRLPPPTAEPRRAAAVTYLT